MITQPNLQYLAARLSQIDSEELAEAAALVVKAQDTLEVFERSTEAEHALFHRLWMHISTSLDHSDFPLEHSAAVESLEAEMAGRTMVLRMSLGWITRSATGPINFPALEEFIPRSNNTSVGY